jgi:hypothetical protein
MKQLALCAIAPPSCRVDVAMLQDREECVDKERFVSAIRVAVQDAAVTTVIETLMKPPGRAPDADLKLWSSWFNGLAFSDRQNVERVIQQTANAAVFGFFCVLDGVRAIEDGEPKGTLVLHYRAANSEVHLNDEDGDLLHDIL